MEFERVLSALDVVFRPLSLVASPVEREVACENLLMAVCPVRGTHLALYRASISVTQFLPVEVGLCEVPLGIVNAGIFLAVSVGVVRIDTGGGLSIVDEGQVTSCQRQAKGTGIDVSLAIALERERFPIHVAA